MENKENNTFQYTYSAEDQDEIKAIRDKYIPKEEQNEDKLTQLRRLDAAVTEKATVVALAIGIIGALVAGTGMSLTMTQIGQIIGLSYNMSMLAGIVAGLLGFFLVCFAYPVYNRIVKNQREKIAPEIIRLADELMK